jgi:hypothetical protein
MMSAINCAAELRVTISALSANPSLRIDYKITGSRLKTCFSCGHISWEVCIIQL